MQGRQRHDWTTAALVGHVQRASNKLAKRGEKQQQRCRKWHIQTWKIHAAKRNREAGHELQRSITAVANPGSSPPARRAHRLLVAAV